MVLLDLNVLGDDMVNNRYGYHVHVEIRDKDFSVIETLNYSGKEAIVDTIVYLDSKYKPSTISLLKRLW